MLRLHADETRKEANKRMIGRLFEHVQLKLSLPVARPTREASIDSSDSDLTFNGWICSRIKGDAGAEVV